MVANEVAIWLAVLAYCFGSVVPAQKLLSTIGSFFSEKE